MKNPGKRRTVRKCARPICIRDGSSRAALCLHGFTGYPGEMAYPASRLKDAGWDVFVPRLSGHGTDGEDFARCGMRYWRRQVRDEWLNLCSLYDEVAVLGHSMGGLLALDLCTEYPVERLAVMAPAIATRMKGMWLLKPLSLLLPRKPIDWTSDPEYVFFDDRDDDDDEFLGREYWSWAWLRQIADLLKLMVQTEKKLGRIETPVLGVFAGRDSVVGKGGRKMLEQTLGGEFRSVVLENCRHYIPYDPEPGMKEEAMDAVIEWFGGEKK